MLKKSSKKILFNDLIEIKNMLQTLLSNGGPTKKDGEVDRFYLEKAIEFQRNLILYDSLLNVGGIDGDADPEKTAPLEKIAIELSDIKSAIESHG